MTGKTIFVCSFSLLFHLSLSLTISSIYNFYFLCPTRILEMFCFAILRGFGCFKHRCQTKKRWRCARCAWCGDFYPKQICEAKLSLVLPLNVNVRSWIWIKNTWHDVVVAVAFRVGVTFSSPIKKLKSNEKWYLIFIIDLEKRNITWTLHHYRQIYWHKFSTSEQRFAFFSYTANHYSMNRSKA